MDALNYTIKEIISPRDKKKGRKGGSFDLFNLNFQRPIRYIPSKQPRVSIKRSLANNLLAKYRNGC